MIKYEAFKKLTSKNYKVFLLFLILTFILWFAIQLTKNYNYTNHMLVKIVDIPKHIVIDSANQPIAVNVKANGLKLLGYNLSDKVLKITFQEFEQDSLQLKMTADQLKNKITKDFKIQAENISINQVLLTFQYRRKQTKLVPVKPDIDISFSPGYNTLQTLKLKPDSVVISGSKPYLEKISHVKTKKLKLKSASDTLRGNIKIQQPLKDVDISEKEVEYYLPVQKFSENTFMVNVQIINVPDSLDVSIFPNQAKVSFLISLKSFDKVSDEDFKVICDYSKRYQEDAIMIPELVKYPDNILNTKLHVKKVDYLIKQKP